MIEPNEHPQPLSTAQAGKATIRESLSRDELRAFVQAWARRLARGDYHLAADLEQDIYLAALRSAPSDEAVWRPWIRRVGMNRLNGLMRIRSRHSATDTDYGNLAAPGGDPSER